MKLLCKDCGVDTKAIHEYYMVKHRVWWTAHRDEESKKGFLCIACIETRLLRHLTWEDFSHYPVNFRVMSERLADRLKGRPAKRFLVFGITDNVQGGMDDMIGACDTREQCQQRISLLRRVFKKFQIYDTQLGRMDVDCLCDSGCMVSHSDAIHPEYL